MDFSKLLATAEDPSLGPGPRQGVWSEKQINEELILGKSGITADRQALVRALILLWHDHLETAHGLAQEIDNPDGAWVHGIMHRREPDYGNAKYWFRRVGAHECFPQLAKRVAEFLKDGEGGGLSERLLGDKRWNAFAFIDECEKAATATNTAEVRLLRAIQRIETEVLLEWFSAQKGE